MNYLLNKFRCCFQGDVDLIIISLNFVLSIVLKFYFIFFLVFLPFDDATVLSELFIRRDK